MKFEIDEDAVLRLNGAAMVALGASVVACPRAHADKAFTAVSRLPAELYCALALHWRTAVMGLHAAWISASRADPGRCCSGCRGRTAARRPHLCKLAKPLSSASKLQAAGFISPFAQQAIM